MVYYHVWDNYPHPHFNAKYYNSTDEVVAISKVTDDIVQTVAPDAHCGYIPHAVNSSIYHKYTTQEEKENAKKLKENVFSASSENIKNPKKKIFFWNNRNARRKQPGTLIYWFKEFLDEVGHDKAILLMHTDPRDQHGQDLPHLIDHLGINNGQVLLSTTKVKPEDLAGMYNVADYTINISDAEGFGLATLESLSCGTPIIVNMTGGLQEQVTNGKDWFGWGITPASKSIIGSLEVPYIYEDRLNKKEFIDTLKKALNASPKAYKKMSDAGQKHVYENYNFDNFERKWVETMDKIVEKHGSWETRRNYCRWQLKEVA
jgi:glycosyltransferase involved in cell wall biosynthesis